MDAAGTSNDAGSDAGKQAGKQASTAMRFQRNNAPTPGTLSILIRSPRFNLSINLTDVGRIAYIFAG